MPILYLVAINQAVVIQVVAPQKVHLYETALRWGETSPALAAVKKNTRSVVANIIDKLANLHPSKHKAGELVLTARVVFRDGV